LKFREMAGTLREMAGTWGDTAGTVREMDEACREMAGTLRETGGARQWRERATAFVIGAKIAASAGSRLRTLGPASLGEVAKPAPTPSIHRKFQGVGDHLGKGK
jgi:hypothetical protein